MGFRLFKTSYRDKSGKAREAAKWYVEFRDHNATVRRLPAFISKAASEEFGRNVVKLVDYHKGTGGQTDPALSRWLASLPQRTREKLVSIGLLDRQRVGASKSLSDHLDDFSRALRAKGNTESHVEVVTGRTRRIFDACGFRFYSDLSASKIMAYLNDLRSDTEKKRGISAQTFNFYLAAVKQFCRWMVKDRRAGESPITHLDGLNVKTDRRRDRRALIVDELRALLDATRAGPDRYGMTGKDRAILYWLAVETGLRAGELRSLTRESFELEGDAPTVTVLAAYSKRRREDSLPVRSELATALRGFLATILPAVRVFKLPNRKRASEMFQADLEAAGIPFRDGTGRVADFHALRHTFISNLASGGIHPKTAQALARHSTITLTMDRYTHTLRGDQADALAVLPDLSRPARQAARATGTEGAKPAGRNLASYLALSGRSEGIPVGAGGRSVPMVVGSASGKQSPENTEKTAEKTANGSVWESNPLRALFKPSTGFEDQGPHQRCKHSQGVRHREG
jgi:integrase/recombinase XerD